MPTLRVIVTGVKRLDKKLAQLPLKIQKKILRPAMRAGLKLVKTAVEAEAPRDTGTLASNVKVRSLGRRKGGRVEMEVRIKGNPALIKTSKSGQRFFYPAGVQYGVKSHNVRPNQFMSRAYRQTGRAARDLTMQWLLDGVNREISAP